MQLERVHSFPMKKKTRVLRSRHISRPGGTPHERDGDARRKIRIKPLKETNLGMAQALFDP